MTSPSRAAAAAPPLRLASVIFTLLVLAASLLPLRTCRLASSEEKQEEKDFSQLFDRVKYFLDYYYLDLDRASPRRLLERSLAALENAADEIYVDNSEAGKSRVKVHVGQKALVINLRRVQKLSDATAQLKDLFTFIRANYEGDESINEIRYATANGFLTGLDPHTLVFSPRAFKDFYTHIEGEIYGVGMLVGVRKGRLHVIQVLKNTPASRAGFKNGDIISKIGDESTINMDVNEAVQKIRGPRGAEIVLTIKRRESKEAKKLATLEIPVKRDLVTIPNVQSKLLPDGIGYIEILNYDKNTVPHMRNHLERLKEKNESRELAGLVLDLRRNSGGLLKQAAEMADYFLSSEDHILYSIADKRGVSDTTARNDRNEPRYPVILLSSESSASGAEIVLGALQKNDRGLVLGNSSFGKGSVQQLHSLRLRNEPEDYDAQLKITVSEYLIPGQISIQENGVVPDILAQMALFSEKEINLFPDERRGTEKDYEHHIVSKYQRDQKPVEVISYPYVFKPEEEEFGDPFMRGDIKPMEDTLVQIALDLMKLVDRSEDRTFSRKRFLEENREGIEAIRQARLQDIVEVLKGRGIDWSAGTNPEDARVELAISHEIIERESADQDDPYPERVLLLKARATNRGTEPLHRVWAVSNSDHYQFNEKEFLFGRIAPGESVERSNEFTLFPSSATRSDMVQLQVRAEGVEDPLLNQDHEVIVQGEEIPDFAYTLTLKNAENGEVIERLEPGIQATLTAEIENTGAGDLLKGVAVLKNKSSRDVFLEVGRPEIKNLNSGEKTTVEFKFKVREDSTRDVYEFDFLIADSHYPAGISRELRIGSGSSGPKLTSGVRESAPEIEVALESADEGSSVVTSRESITLRSEIEHETRSFNAWVGTTPLSLSNKQPPDKITFSRARGGDEGYEARIEATIPLKEGQNIVTILAKSEDGLTSRKVLYVRRTPIATASKESSTP